MLPNKLGTPMANLTIRFYGELNDYLPLAKRGRSFVVEHKNQISVNRLINSICVPSSTIDLILVNGYLSCFVYQQFSYYTQAYLMPTAKLTRKLM